jgi:hypothetical protein
VSRNFTGALKATHQYPRFVWDGNTLDFDDPLPQRDPESAPSAGSNVSSSGLREVLFERLEYYCTISTPMLYEEKAAQVERMLRENLGRGRQAEVFIDRTLRAHWGFDDDTVEDNNHGNPFRRGDITVDGFTFADLSIGRGVNVPTTGTCRARLVSELPGGSSNFFFQPAAGTLAYAFKPSWASDDSAEHVLLDCWAESDLSRNRLTIRKRPDNLLHLVHVDQNGAETILEANVATGQPLKWSANTEHILLVQWGATSDLAASLDGTAIATKKYPIVASGSRLAGTGLLSGQVGSSALGSETVMNASPTVASLGQDATGFEGRGTGVVGLINLLAVVYSPGLPAILGTYIMPWRTYLPRGELIAAGWQPKRLSLGRNFVAYQLRIRDGR